MHHLMLNFLAPFHIAIDGSLLTSHSILPFSKELSHDNHMGIEDPKIRLFILIMINLIVILAFRYWVLNNEAFVWLLNGLPS